MRTAVVVASGMLAVGATVVGASAVLPVGATGATTAAPQSRKVTIHVVDTDQKVAVHDVNHNGRLDFGDNAVFRTVDARPNGTKVGHGIGQIDILGPHDNLMTFTLILAAGDITMQGDIHGLESGTRSQLAVTGGTRHYANAHGVTTARQMDGGATDLVIRLSR